MSFVIYPPGILREAATAQREHFEFWWFYTRLTKSEQRTTTNIAPGTLPAPFGLNESQLIENAAAAYSLSEDVPSNNQFYGNGGISFDDEETAVSVFEQCRASVEKYFERDGFLLDYLDFSLILVRTSGALDLPLVIKPHTILRRHREEAVENSATSIIWVEEDAFVN